MNNILTEPVGIDETIQMFQINLYRELSKIWNGDIEGYGRVEKNPMNNGEETPTYYQTSKIVIPEWFNSSKQDYEEVYYDDDKSCVFCFLKGDTDDTDDGMVFNSKIKGVFMIDLNRIYPDKKERITSKAHKDVMEIFREFGTGLFKINGLEQRIEIIFREYDTSKIKFDDMHPLHCFAVTLDLHYYLTNNCI